MKNYFEKQFELRYFELNKFGEAQATTILTLLEETAADHCWSIDHSLYDLKYQNIGWVLLSGAIVMERYPLYKEKIIIRTWLSHYTPIRGLRENIIFDSRRNIIGRSTGLWVFFDLNRRRPARISSNMRSGRRRAYSTISAKNGLVMKKKAPVSISPKPLIRSCPACIRSNFM